MRSVHRVFRLGATWALMCGLLAVHGHTLAQALRDPTAPPKPAPSARGSGAGGTAERDLALAVLIDGGKPFVMLDSRLYGVGDKLVAARIERITETEVWLREGSDLRKISLYPGVQRLQPVPVKE